MHQTTVRFSAELWSMLESEAAQAGISVAHYVRDAVLARLAFAAGQRSAEAGPFAWADPRIIGAVQAQEAGHAGAPGAQEHRTLGRPAQLRARAQGTRRPGGR
jgi:hypothetical protein